MTKKPLWQRQQQKTHDWPAWLAEGDDTTQMNIMRKHIESGLPCGSGQFIKKLERMVDRQLGYRPQGRPRRG